MGSLQGARVLVTGGAGFIGSHLVDLLRAERDAEVVVLDNLEPQTHPAGAPPWLRQEVKYYFADVRDVEAVARALDGVQYVFHLAAYGGFVENVSKYMDVNATGTVRLYEAARREKGVQKIVVASSQGIYGEGLYRDAQENERQVDMRDLRALAGGKWEHFDSATGEMLKPVPTPETRQHASLNLYSISKYAAERSALALGAAYAIPTCCLRYAVTYGPRQSLFNPYTGVVSIFSTQILNGRDPAPYEDGLQTRDFIFVADNVRANLLAMEHESTAGQVYNVSTEVATTIDQLARVLAECYGKPGRTPQYRDVYRPADVRHLVLDGSKLRALGFTPRVGLREGISRFAQWIATQEKVPELFSTAEAGLMAGGVVRSVHGR